MHVANFVKLAMQKRYCFYRKASLSQLKDEQSSVNWQNIITAYIDIVGSGNKKLMELTEHAVELFPYDSNFLILRKLSSCKAYYI